MPSALKIAYYGDDFTGATDTLATAARAGLRTLLFLGLPSPAQLERAAPTCKPGNKKPCSAR